MALRPGAATSSRARRSYWVVLAVVAVGTFMSTLDTSIVNVALPTLARVFNVDLPALEWVITAYLLSISALLPVSGRVADIVGRSRVFSMGLLVFVVGSALCGLASSSGALVAFRVIQAVGAAMVMANGMAIVTTAFPPERRGQALGIMGTVVAAGSITGPVIGGFVVAGLGWKWIFYINLPIGVAGFLLARGILPRDARSGGGGFDVPGFALFTAALLSLLLGLQFAGRDGWDGYRSVSLIAFAAVSAAVFVVFEGRTRHPMIDLGLFRNRLFLTGNVAGFVSYVAMFFNVVLMPFYLQDVLGFPPDRVGLLMVPVPLAIAVAAPLSGYLSDRLGPGVLTVGGMAVLSGSLALLSTLRVDTPFTGVVLRLALLGAGMGIFASPNNSAIMGSVPREKYGITSGLIALVRNVGMVIGVAISVSIFTGQLARNTAALGPSPGDAARAGAFVASLSTVYLTGAAIAFLGIFVSWTRARRWTAGRNGA